MSGATFEQVNSASFSKALQSAVSIHLRGPATVAVSSATGGMHRLILTDVTIHYTVSIVSGMDALTLVTKFNDAVSTGVFLTSFNQLSGLRLTHITNTVVFDATPTGSPTSSPHLKGTFTPSPYYL